MLLFVLGAVGGFVTSMPPIGPISVLVLRAGLTARYRAALTLACGAAVAEALYAAAAVFGLSWILERWSGATEALHWSAAVVLVALGAYLLRTNPLRSSAGRRSDRGHGGLIAGFVISILNPTLLATWSAGAAMVISLTGLRLGPWDRLTFPLGVGFGIVGWFVLVLWLVGRYGHRLQQETAAGLIRIMGAAILGLGCWRIISLATGASA